MIIRMVTFALVLMLNIGLGFGIEMSSVDKLPKLNFIHRVYLDPQGTFIMQWIPQDEEITIEIQVQTQGYVGLGFSKTGGMKGSDIVIGWIDYEGIVQFTDRHAVNHITPIVDESQDYKLLAGYKNDTHTVLRFSRPWVTCDKMNDFTLTGDTIRVIWAYDHDLPDPSSTRLSRHHFYGTKSLYLKEPKMVKPFDVDVGSRTWDVRTPNVELPVDFDTLYWCTLYKIPDLSRKHQVIGYYPLIEEYSLPHVHHMLLYECTLKGSEKYFEKWVEQKGAQCYSRNMPISWNACGTAIVAWAIGSEGEMLPDNVGFPLGEKYGGTSYFLLEVHYDNPKFIKGIVDNSGLRMILTDRPREYDAGTLTVGHKVEPSMIIPPNRVWSTKGHCTSDCTQKTLPPDGIKVFSGIMHAHLLGQSIKVQHIRDGKELPPLISDTTYDFNYQQARVFPTEKVVIPGDHLIATCLYNATHRNVATFGGFGTEDEMCLVFLSYYPRLNLAECHSRPDLALLFDVFGIENLYENDRIMNAFKQSNFDENSISDTLEDQNFVTMEGLQKPGANADWFKLVHYFRIVNISEPKSLRGKTFYDILTDKSTWLDMRLTQRLEEAVTNLPYEPTCLYSGRGVVEGLPRKAKMPHFTPFQPIEENCIQGDKEVRKNPKFPDKQEEEVYTETQNELPEDLLNSKLQLKEGDSAAEKPFSSFTILGAVTLVTISCLK